MSLKVTATQGGSTANGILLRVYVLTGAAPAGAQKGATVAHTFSTATGTWTQSITTTQTGSRVYGAANPSSDSLTVTPAALTTVVDDVNDATNNETYITFKATSLTGTPGATTLGFTIQSESGSFVMAEILTTGGLTEDPSAPAAADTLTATTVSTANFSPPPGSLLVAVVSSDGGASVTTMTVSGGLLNWTALASSNASNQDYVGIWVAQVPAANKRIFSIARQPFPVLKGRVYSTAQPAVQSAPPPPSSGPVFYPARIAVRAMLPQPPMGIGAFRGRVASSPGAPVRNPNPGPVFRQRTTPVRFILPPPAPRAGRIGSSFGAPIENPVHGPPAYPLQEPVRARVPQLQPRAGRAYSNTGAPVRNPQKGPAFRQANHPAAARIPLARRGRVNSSPGTISAAAVQPVLFIPKTSVQAKLPLLRRGVCRAIRFYSLTGNPQPGPVFTQASQPARTRPSLPLRGRIASNPGIPVPKPVPIAAAPVPLTQPIGIRVVMLRTGHTQTSGASPVRNPNPGPVFHQVTSAVRAHVPQISPRGRIGSNPGTAATAPVVHAGPVFYPKTFIRAQLPLSRRGTCRAIRFYPLGTSPSSGPEFIQATQPARIRPVLPPRGRCITGNPGAPVNNPIPPVVQIGSCPVLDEAGNVITDEAGNWILSEGCHLQGSLPGPIRAQLPRPFLKGRISSNSGAPVRNPARGPVFRQANTPARARVLPPARGRTYPSRLTAAKIPSVGPVFQQADQALRARLPLQPVLRGRISSSAGAPVRNPAPGPVFRQKTSTIQARTPLPPRGRIGNNPGGPVRNPGPIGTGPVFYPLTHPVRAPIPPQQPRGGRKFGFTPKIVQLTNNAEGGTAGTTVTGGSAGNTGSGSGASFDAVSIGSGSTLTFDSTRAAHGLLSYKVTSTSVSSELIWTSSFAPDSVPVLWFRFYIFVPTGGLGSGIRPVAARTIGGAAGPSLLISSFGHIEIQNAAFSGTVTFSNSLPLNQWVRFEGYFVGHPTAGVASASLFYPMDSVSPVETQTVTNYNTGGVFTQVLFGTSANSSAQTFWQDDIGVSTAGYLGPVGLPSGAVFTPQQFPIQARIPQVFSKGRVYSSPGGPIQNPPAPLYPLQSPVRSHPAPPVRGRTGSNAGILPQHLAPVYGLHSPVRSHPAPPARGRISSNKGFRTAPYVSAEVYPLQGPVRARTPLPARGRVASNKGAPVRNPQKGPLFRQAVKPVRAVIPRNAPRGRVGNNPGGPVENIPFTELQIVTGNPYTQWKTGSPYQNWDTDDPLIQWETASPYIAWEIT